MTREEALKELCVAQADVWYRPSDDAIDMAIEALELVTSYEDTINKLTEAIANTQEPKWIPVSERSPEDNKEVLVYVNAYPYLAWLDGGEWKTEDFIIEKDFEPIAWMPLPEPYKAESEE